MSVIVRSSSAFCSAKGLISTPVAIRCCSSLEEIKAGLEHVKRHRKVVQGTVLPKTLTAGLGSGKELNIAANMSEVAALSGMPDAHQKRTVVIQPRQLKTLQSGKKKGKEMMRQITALVSPG
jgi:hypothetical protein